MSVANASHRVSRIRQCATVAKIRKARRSRFTRPNPPEEADVIAASRRRYHFGKTLQRTKWIEASGLTA